MTPPRKLFFGECCEGLFTRRGFLSKALAGGALVAGAAALPRAAAASQSSWRPSPRPVYSDDAYTSLVPAAIGGPMIANRHVISLRWLGCSCFELVHRGRVYLLDAWFDRGPRTRSIGFTDDDVVRAETIFVGHGHFDHIADAPPIAARTGATIVGAPISTGYAASVGTPSSQLQTVKGLGAELLHYDGFTVEPILAHHAVAPSRTNTKGETVGQALFDAYSAALDPFTPAETEAFQAMLARGSFNPLIITEGTIAYLFTFDSGYRMIWLDSGGPITAQMREVMSRIGKTNLAIASYTVQGIPPLQVPVTMALVNLFKPDLFLPCHHDEIVLLPFNAVLPDMATEPLRMAIRDTRPDTRSLAPLYRSPVVINTRTLERHGEQEGRR